MIGINLMEIDEDKISKGLEINDIQCTFLDYAFNILSFLEKHPSNKKNVIKFDDMMECINFNGDKETMTVEYNFLISEAFRLISLARKDYPEGFRMAYIDAGFQQMSKAMAEHEIK